MIATINIVNIKFSESLLNKHSGKQHRTVQSFPTGHHSFKIKIALLVSFRFRSMWVNCYSTVERLNYPSPSPSPFLPPSLSLSLFIPSFLYYVLLVNETFLYLSKSRFFLFVDYVLLWYQENLSKQIELTSAFGFFLPKSYMFSHVVFLFSFTDQK